MRCRMRLYIKYTLLLSWALVGINCQFSKVNVTSPKLPLWCYNTDGTKCSWYRECLEERFPCEQTDSAYAVTFAEKFCDQYAKNIQMFSSYGQQWIAAAKKCLQVALVPILSSTVNESCADIKRIAFASHPKCYTSPSDGFSFCSLNLQDKFAVFWTIKEAFLSAFGETIKAIAITASECL